jgi:hypothetical protein
VRAVKVSVKQSLPTWWLNPAALAGAAEDIFTSLFNSHLFDFNDGWMYVFGVGIAGGMLRRASPCGAEAEMRKGARS